MEVREKILIIETAKPMSTPFSVQSVGIIKK